MEKKNQNGKIPNSEHGNGQSAASHARIVQCMCSIRTERTHRKKPFWSMGACCGGIFNPFVCWWFQCSPLFSEFFFSSPALYFSIVHSFNSIEFLVWDFLQFPIKCSNKLNTHTHTHAQTISELKSRVFWQTTAPNSRYWKQIDTKCY